MLLERSQLLVGVIAAAVVAVGTAYAVGATGGAFVPGFPMSAEFEDAAGLENGDFVFVAGVRSGQVTGVRIEGDKVVADFNLTSDGVPSDSTASIILQSTLGRRAIMLSPGTSTDYFEEGDQIPVGRTSTPVDLPELGDRGSELLGEVDVVAMRDIVEALADINDGARQDVEQLLDGIQRVSELIVERRGELEHVIQQAQVLVDAAADQDREIVRIIDAFGSTLDTLLAKRGEISRLLDETGDTSTTTAALIQERRAQIDQVLDEVRDDLAIVDAHQVDLANLFAVAGVGYEGFASIGYHGGEAKLDNPHWGNVFTTGLGSAGIQALAGCGSPIDRAFTMVLGPDPSCDGANDLEPAADSPEAKEGEAGDHTAFEDGLGGFFSPAVPISRLDEAVEGTAVELPIRGLLP